MYSVGLLGLSLSAYTSKGDSGGAGEGGGEGGGVVGWYEGVVSYVTGASNWYWLTVGQGLLSF